ncbi:hypothetical protein C0Q70_02079 [Pomacea canaliculata]|uniref:Uncharacterized protein n=1 Tax=Pomacea canaliculata TaxID=400727 RepID=A0A2T7Q1A8_POMCA|nr:hypothetical protein C0Q70_02079 [Pomacea canaliculata]
MALRRASTRLHGSFTKGFTKASTRLTTAYEGFSTRLHDGFTKASTRLRQGFTKASEGFNTASRRLHEGFNTLHDGLRRLQHGFAKASRRLHEGLNTASRRLHEGFNTASRRLHEGFNTASPRLHEGFTKASTWFGFTTEALTRLTASEASRPSTRLHEAGFTGFNDGFTKVKGFTKASELQHGFTTTTRLHDALRRLQHGSRAGHFNPYDVVHSTIIKRLRARASVCVLSAQALVCATSSFTTASGLHRLPPSRRLNTASPRLPRRLHASGFDDSTRLQRRLHTASGYNVQHCLH